MKAAVLKDEGRLAIEDRPAPRIEDPHEVLIEPAGVALGEDDFRGPDGCVPGRAFAGRVLEAGAEVTNVRPGEHVTAEAFHYCGQCEACRVPHYSACLVPRELGRTIDGALCERMVVDSRFCWSIDDLMHAFGPQKGCELGATVLPLATAYHALFIAGGGGFVPGESVVVYGSGMLSLCAVALARSAGAGRVLLVEETGSEASELACRLGASAAHGADELARRGVKPHRAVLEATGGLGAAVQVETSGRADLFMEEMQQCMAMKGRVVCAVRQGRRTPIYLEPFVTRMAKVTSARGHAGYAVFPNVIEILGSGAADMTVAVLGRTCLADMPGAVQRARQQPWGIWMVSVVGDDKE